MSLSYTIAIAIVPFLDLLDKEEDELAAIVLEAEDEDKIGTAIDTSRRHLAQGVDAVVRSLPASIRADNATTQAVAYAMVGLADERMLHHPAGGLHRWRERLLEYELYGSALAGQEIVNRARATTFGTSSAGAQSSGSDPNTASGALLAPLYLAVFRSGFEGSLRGNSSALTALMSSLAESVGGSRLIESGLIGDVRPKRVGSAPVPLALIGIVAWLFGGLALWWVLPQASLGLSRDFAVRVASGQAPVLEEPFVRRIGPSGLPPLEPKTQNK